MRNRAPIVEISCGWEGVLSCGKRASVKSGQDEINGIDTR